MHGFITLSDATSYDKKRNTKFVMTTTVKQTEFVLFLISVTTEGFFNIWRKEPLVTTRSEGFQQLSTVLDSEPLTLLQRISVAKRVVKILATLHTHEVVQNGLIIDDILIKKNVNVSKLFLFLMIPKITK